MSLKKLMPSCTVKYGTTLDGLTDLSSGVTESLSVVGAINKYSAFHVRLLACLLTNTSILTAVAHRPPTSTTSSAPKSVTSPQSNNEENNNNNSISSNNSSTTANCQTKEQLQKSSRSVTDRLHRHPRRPHYQIPAVDKVDTLSEETVPFVRLRCPYGSHGESTGGGKNWDKSVSTSERLNVSDSHPTSWLTAWRRVLSEFARFHPNV